MDSVRQAVPPGTPLFFGPLRLRIDFFFDGQTQVDADNIIKPIQDALKQVVYVDDETVTDVCSRKVDIQHLPSLVDVPAKLLGALAEPPSDFVYVRVASSCDEMSFL